MRTSEWTSARSIVSPFLCAQENKTTIQVACVHKPLALNHRKEALDQLPPHFGVVGDKTPDVQKSWSEFP